MFEVRSLLFSSLSDLYFIVSVVSSLFRLAVVLWDGPGLPGL